jgi:hypothetical protein
LIRSGVFVLAQILIPNVRVILLVELPTLCVTLIRFIFRQVCKWGLILGCSQSRSNLIHHYLSHHHHHHQNRRQGWIWFGFGGKPNWTKLFLKFIIIEPNCLSLKLNRIIKVVRFYGFKLNHNWTESNC